MLACLIHVTLLTSVWLVNIAAADEELSLEIKRANVEIVVDGRFDEWVEIEWFPVSEGLPEVSHIRFNQLEDDGSTEPAGTARTAADLSSLFAMQWDEKCLYLAAKVTDNVHVVGKAGGESGWYTRDGVSLFLDVPNDGDGGNWISGDHAFSFIADNDIGGWWRHGDETGQREVAMPDAVEYTVLQGDGGNYTLEAAIPMDLLGELTPEWKPPFAGKNMGFLLLVSDPDGKQPDWGGQLIFGGDDDNDAGWADLILVEDRPQEAKEHRPETGKIEGQVLLRSTGEAWMGGEVNVFDADGQEVTSTFVDNSGRYEVMVPAGEYRVVAAGQTAEVDIQRSQMVKNLDFTVEPVLVQLQMPVEPTDQQVALYQNRLVPLLQNHGFALSVSSSEHAADKRVAGLFAIPSVGSFMRQRMALERDPAWISAIAELYRDVDRASGSVLHPKLVPAGTGGKGLLGPEKAREFGEHRIASGSGTGSGAWLNLGVPDGLPYPAITSLLKDSQGGLWLQSVGQFNAFFRRGDLLRYDGEYWTNYSVTGKDTLITDGYTISEDRSGNIWVSISGVWGSISREPDVIVGRYDGRSWTSYSLKKASGVKEVYAVVADGEAGVWLGTDNGVIRFLDGKQTTYTVEDGLVHNRVMAIAADRKGQMWFGTGRGISVFDGQHFLTHSEADGLPSREINALLEDRSGRMWVGTEKGLVSYDDSRFRKWTMASGEFSRAIVTALFEDRSGQLWIGTNAGLYRVVDDKIKRVEMEGGSDAIMSLCDDDEGHLWIGTADGLSRYDNAGLSRFTREDGLPADAVFGLAEDLDGNVWMGTRSGVTKYDGDVLKTFGRDNFLGGEINGILVDQKGALLVPTNLGLNTYHQGTWKQLSYASFALPVFERTGRWTEDREGDLWYSSHLGTAILDEERGWRRFDSGGVIEGELFSAIPGLLQDRQGRYWFDASREWGLYAYDGIQWENFSEKHGAPGSARCALETRDGHIWFGTGYGAYRFDGTSFTHYGVEDGLSHRVVSSMIEDRRGRVWFGTAGGGVSIYDGTAFQRLLRKDGLLSNTVSDLLEDAEGGIWIATNRGVNRYQPGLSHPPVRVTDVIADRRYGLVADLSMPSSQHFVAFEFRGTSFKTRQMLYAYRLQPVGGPEAAWELTPDNRIEFVDLERGEYTFQVRAVDRDLNYSEQPAEVALTVHIPYEQWSYGALLAAASMGLVVAGFSIVKRRRQLRRAMRAHNEMLEKELQTAQSMQMGLMPTASPEIEGFDISGICRPATHVGGDFFQYFTLPDGRITLALADVTGHGMEAAIPTVLFSGILDSQMENATAPEELFPRLNRSLYRTLDRRTFVCFSMGELDPSSRRLRLVNGGCPYPYHYRSSMGTVEELHMDAFPLGFRPEAEYSVVEVTLEPGDRVVFCSDGIIEAENGIEEIFGFERTAEAIGRAAKSGAGSADLIDRLLAEVDAFSGKTEQADDQTIIVLAAK